MGLAATGAIITGTATGTDITANAAFSIRINATDLERDALGIRNRQRCGCSIAAGAAISAVTTGAALASCASLTAEGAITAGAAFAACGTDSEPITVDFQTADAAESHARSTGLAAFAAISTITGIAALATFATSAAGATFATGTASATFSASSFDIRLRLSLLVIVIQIHAEAGHIFYSDIVHRGSAAITAIATITAVATSAALANSIGIREALATTASATVTTIATFTAGDDEFIFSHRVIDHMDIDIAALANDNAIARRIAARCTGRSIATIAASRWIRGAFVSFGFYSVHLGWSPRCPFVHAFSTIFLRRSRLLLTLWRIPTVLTTGNFCSAFLVSDGDGRMAKATSIRLHSPSHGHSGFGGILAIYAFDRHLADSKRHVFRIAGSFTILRYIDLLIRDRALVLFIGIVASRILGRPVGFYLTDHAIGHAQEGHRNRSHQLYTLLCFFLHTYSPFMDTHTHARSALRHSASAAFPLLVGLWENCTILFLNLSIKVL